MVCLRGIGCLVIDGKLFIQVFHFCCTSLGTSSSHLSGSFHRDCRSTFDGMMAGANRPSISYTLEEMEAMIRLVRICSWSSCLLGGMAM